MIDLIGASGAIAAADNGDGTYTLTFADETKRMATAEEIAAAARAAIRPVTRRQMFRALADDAAMATLGLPAGMLDMVLAFVATRSREEQIDFAESQEFQRDNASLNSGAAALGMTDEQVDSLFALAATK